jgi:hypothetical protein
MFVKHLCPPWTYIIGCTSLYFGNEWKLQIIGIFLSLRVITPSKMAQCTQNWSWARYSYDKSVNQISFQYVHPVQRKWTETANYWNFSKSKGHNSVKNGSIVLITYLDLDILTINLYTKFHFNMCNQCKENEWKLQIIGIFRSPRAITLAKMARSYPKYKLT